MISKNKFLQKLISIAGLSLIYFWSRIQNLTAIPIFGDEAIYIRWSQIIKNVETLRFIPLTDGKQPLFMWAMVPLFKFFSDPLVAGRFLSILSGFGSLVTLLFLSSIILNYSSSKTNQPHLFVWQSINRFFYPSLVSSLIYLCLPFTFFFDRLATADSLLSFLGLLSFFTSLLLAKFPRLDLSLILGIVLGLAWITKSPAIYFIVLSILSFVIITKKLKLIYYPLISATISFCIYNLLRLGPQFHMIGIRNKDYVWSISDILKHPLDPLKPHLIDIFNISSLFISIPVIALFFTCLYLFIKQKQKLTIFIVTLFWSILPLIANASFAKVFTPDTFFLLSLI